MYCVLRQTQLTVLSINTNFSSMLHDKEKVIFCSWLGGHFAEQEKENEEEELEVKREYPVYVNPLQLDLAV